MTRATHASRAFPASVASRRSQVELALVRVLDAVMTWQDRARQRRHLSSLDDHMLHDVGLSRADLERESTKPFWRP